MINDPKSSEKIHQIIDLYKTILIEANHSDDDLYGYYRNHTVSSLGKQISMLFEYQDPSNGYKIFLDNWQKLFDSSFEIYMKAIRNDSRSISISLDVQKIINKSKFKDHKRFNQYILEKILECTSFLNANWKEIDAKTVEKIRDKSDKKSCLEFYYYFIRPFIYYIRNEIHDIKNCCKPCLNLLVELSKNAHSSKDYLEIISELLYKDNFYVLKDYKTETVVLCDNLIALAYEFVNLEGDMTEWQKNRYKLISGIYGYLKDRLRKFPESIQYAQESFFEPLFCKPVEMDDLNEKFYYLIYNNIFQIVEINYIYSLDEKYRKRLSHVLEVLLSNDSLDYIQPENSVKWRFRTLYYDSWFSKIGDLLKDGKNLDSSLIESLTRVVEKIREYDSYIDLFDSNSFTVNYHIIQWFSRSFSNLDADEKLISALIATWGDIFMKKDETLTRNFFQYMYQVCLTHPKCLATIGDKLWDFYLEGNMKDTQLPFILESILPYTRSLFMERYKKRFLDMTLNDLQNLYNKSYSFLLKLFQHCPQFYFEIEGNKLYITNLIENSKLVPNLNSLNYGIFTQFVKTLKDNEGKLLKENFNVIYQHRKEFWTFAFNEIKDDRFQLIKIKEFSGEWILISIGELYYMILNKTEKKDKKKTVRLFVNEILQYLERVEPKSDRPYQLVDILKGFGEMENKAYLDIIREHRETFVGYKQDWQNNPNGLNSAGFILDLIDDRNMETFSNKITENQQNILKINEDLAEKSAEIRTLDENVRANEESINAVKSDVVQLGDKVEAINKQIEQQNQRMDQLDSKTLFNIPPWCEKIKVSMTKNHQDWILVAKRLNFSDRDIKGWLNQIDPFMSMLQEWFIANKTSDAILGLMKVFKELNNRECAQIIQDSIDQIEEESKDMFKDYKIDEKMKRNPAHVFISFEWSSKEKAQMLQKYLFEEINKECGVTNLNDADNRINIWFDDGNMGGGVERNNRIDLGLRLCNVLVCLITSEMNKDQTSLNQINLAIQLNKPIIPLLLDSKLKWPPSGSLGPILSEYLFIRFFQRPKEVTNDERYWPVDKFKELTMQLKQIIPFTLNTTKIDSSPSIVKKDHPEIFISYQWDKQKQVLKLYEKLTNLGLKCWLDIYQMGGGDSLYFKIDEGIRNCAVVISCVTMKYSQSANCRKEIALSDAVSKPIVPILVEKGLKYPPPGPMSPTLGVLKFIDFTGNITEDGDILWQGNPFKELMEALKPHFSQKTVDSVTSKACIIS